MRRLLTCLLCLLSVSLLFGAADTTRTKTNKRDSIVARIRYYGYFQWGSLISCSSCAGGRQITSTAAVVQGITIGSRLRVGVGVGLDSHYGWQVIPVFGSVEVDVFKIRKKNAVFAQFQYGGSYASINDEYKSYGFVNDTGGRMVYPQIGYRINYHQLKLGLLIGYKDQRLSSSYEYPSYRPMFNSLWLPGDPSRSVAEQKLRRLAITLLLGWQ